MEEEYKLKLALISGASHALKYKDNNRNADTDEVIQYISDMADEILDKIDEEER